MKQNDFAKMEWKFRRNFSQKPHTYYMTIEWTCFKHTHFGRNRKKWKWQIVEKIHSFIRTHGYSIWMGKSFSSIYVIVSSFLRGREAESCASCFPDDVELIINALHVIYKIISASARLTSFFFQCFCQCDCVLHYIIRTTLQSILNFMRHTHTQTH